MSSLVLAEVNPAFYREVNIDSNITFQCTLESTGLDCPANFECNWTLVDPASLIVIDNKAFTNNNYYHNYTLEGSVIDSVGDYYAKVRCSNSTYGIGSSFIIRVNTSGREDNFTLLLGMFAVLVVMIGGYLYAAFNVDEEKFRLKIILFFASFFNMMGALLAAILTQTNWYNIYLVLEGILLLNGLIIVLMIFYYTYYIIQQRIKAIEEQ